MEGWQYKVVFVDFRGRISVEGEETLINKGERSTAFVRRYLDQLGRDGWELVAVHQQMPPEKGYFVFKKAGAAPVEEVKVETSTAAETSNPTAPTQTLSA